MSCAILPSDCLLWSVVKVTGRSLSVKDISLIWILYINLTYFFIVNLWRKKRKYTICHSHENQIIFLKIKLIKFANLYEYKQYLHFVHPNVKLHWCLIHEHRSAHLFPNVGYSHTLLQFPPKKPGGHSLKKKNTMNNEGCSFSFILLQKKHSFTV